VCCTFNFQCDYDKIRPRNESKFVCGCDGYYCDTDLGNMFDGKIIIYMMVGVIWSLIKSLN